MSRTATALRGNGRLACQCGASPNLGPPTLPSIVIFGLRHQFESGRVSYRPTTWANHLVMPEVSCPEIQTTALEASLAGIPHVHDGVG